VDRWNRHRLLVLTQVLAMLQSAALALLALVSLVGMPYTVLMPVFADEILRGGPNTLGLLMAAPGVRLTGRNAGGTRRTR
jgi:hypothetical protein